MCARKGTAVAVLRAGVQAPCKCKLAKLKESHYHTHTPRFINPLNRSVCVSSSPRARLLRRPLRALRICRGFRSSGRSPPLIGGLFSRSRERTRIALRGFFFRDATRSGYLQVRRTCSLSLSLSLSLHTEERLHNSRNSTVIFAGILRPGWLNFEGLWAPKVKWNITERSCTDGRGRQRNALTGIRYSRAFLMPASVPRTIINKTLKYARACPKMLAYANLRTHAS